MIHLRTHLWSRSMILLLQENNRRCFLLNLMNFLVLLETFMVFLKLT